MKIAIAIKYFIVSLFRILFYHRLSHGSIEYVLWQEDVERYEDLEAANKVLVEDIKMYHYQLIHYKQKIKHLKELVKEHNYE